MEIIFFPLVAIFLTYILITRSRINSKWKKAPILSDYMLKHPDCKTSNGLKCAQCGSISIKNWGLLAHNDKRRILSFNHCGTELYRSQ
ncbi:hypothetical protein HNQ57_001367 [Zhongshania antarctica]|uniref:Uncharacterized protein n=1 Tax=Zhongshania antarctica TaxID=641702 RepID=A0A840R3I9_9GAMM|nr:hypothetical protein [Zhongshania antarctica]